MKLLPVYVCSECGIAWDKEELNAAEHKNWGVYYGLNKGGKMKQFLKDNYNLIDMIILTLATIILGLSWIWE